MITVKNYQDQKNNVAWSKMPKAVQDTRNDVEEIMEFYDDDTDIKETVDIFLKQINDNSKPVGEIVFAKVPKYDVDDARKEDIPNGSILKSEIVNGTKIEISSKGSKFQFSIDGKGSDIGSYDDILKKYSEHKKILESNSKVPATKKEPKPKGPAKKETHPQPKYKIGDSVDYRIPLKKDKKSIGKIINVTKVPLGSIIARYIIETFYYGKNQIHEVEESNIIRKVIVPKKEPKTPAKTKIAKVLDKTIVDNFSPEFLLIRRFWNIIKTETVHVPFRTVQLLYMAFNKAAVERKVRKTSEAAELFTACNKKIITLFEDIPNDDKKPYEIEFTDKKLYNQIKEYVSDVAVNPAIPLLKRFIAMQNTKPEIKKAETLLKSINKIFESDKENRLFDEIKLAKISLSDFISGRDKIVDITTYGLSRPATKKVCKNRVKCSGLTPNGRLKKGYRFEEDSNNVIRVVKGLGSPKVCHNRVKCAGLTPNGQLRKGYKFREDTNEVIRVAKEQAKRKPTAKKPVAKKKVVVGLGFSDSIEKVYANPIIPITNEKEMYYKFDAESIKQPAPKPTEQISQPAMEQPVVKNKLMNMQFDSLQMDEGWEDFMQNPARNMRLAIWGPPKNGKTAGSLQLANYLSKFGKVLYNFADQGFNKSTQDLWQMSGLANNPKAEPNDAQTLAELEKEIATGKYTFVFIDMISDYINKEGIKPYEFKERFMKKYPKVSFVLVFEVTKGGNFKGDQGWTHIVDAIVTVEDFLMENRGRYGIGSHIVWEDGLKKFNAKRYEEVMNELNPEQLEFNEVERI